MALDNLHYKVGYNLVACMLKFMVQKEAQQQNLRSSFCCGHSSLNIIFLLLLLLHVCLDNTLINLH